MSAASAERRAGYVFCPVDGFWFRPAYTNGACPLCGEVVDGDAGALDRSWYGPAGLALLSLVMLVLVLFLYFRS